MDKVKGEAAPMMALRGGGPNLFSGRGFLERRGKKGLNAQSGMPRNTE